jgi:small-conductance mechanosensitive channel
MRIPSGIVLVALLAAIPATAQEAPEVVETAPVVVDGIELFPVRGIPAMPAEERAAAIARRIRDVARDRTFDPATLSVVPGEGAVEIVGRGRTLMVVTPADAAKDGVEPLVVARLTTEVIRRAVERYRNERTPAALAAATGIALATLVVLAAALFLLRRFFRWLDGALDRRYGGRVRALKLKALPTLDAERLWNGLRQLIRAVHFLLVAAAVLLAVEAALEVFPWTRLASRSLVSYLLTPLWTIAEAVLAYLPRAAFLIVLVFVVRWLLKLIALLFQGIERGAIEFSGFEPDWAPPTYRLVRIVVLALAVVVAYPYLPGANSGAFKGVSLFLGVMLSLGSTSAIANIIAGYSLTYRRAFKVGDVIRVGEHMGKVIETRVQVTHLRTVKNEEVVIPNSVILNGEVVNYSTISRREGLILHTTVGIGYEVPWRQVEAMLLEAGRRTVGVRTDPPPFVLQRKLGDFAVEYELNVYTDNPTGQARTYSELHRNIQDVFNEYGVQIMTPAYEADPPEAKVVPKERWFAAPAKPPARTNS